MKLLPDVIKDFNCPTKKWENFFFWMKFLIPFIASLMIAIIFFYCNTLDCFIYSTTNSTLFSNGNSLLKDSMAINFSIIAIIIPINLLLISTITSRNPLFVVNYIIRNIRPLETVIIILVFLMMNILTYFIFLFIISNSNQFNESLTRLIIYSSIFYSFLPLFQASLLVYRTTRLLNENNLYKSIRNGITKDLMISVCLDEKSKKIRKDFERDLNEFGIKFNDNNKTCSKYKKTIKFQHKMGFNDYINGINLTEYKKFKKNLRRYKNKKLGVFIIPRPRMSVDSYIKFCTNIDEKSVESSFKKLFKIQELNLKLKFDELKDAIVDSIKKNEESKLERLNKTYFGFLSEYVKEANKYSLKMDYKEVLDSKIQYRSLRHLCYDLKDIIREATKSRNDRMIEIFALEIFKISQIAIENKDYPILKILMRNKRLIYDYSVEHDNRKGKLMSVKYTIKMIRCLNNPDNLNSQDDEIIPTICEEYGSILDEILEKSEENKDYDLIEYVKNKYIKNNILKEFLSTKLEKNE